MYNMFERFEGWWCPPHDSLLCTPISQSLRRPLARGKVSCARATIAFESGLGKYDYFVRMCQQPCQKCDENFWLIKSVCHNYLGIEWWLYSHWYGLSICESWGSLFLPQLHMPPVSAWRGVKEGNDHWQRHSNWTAQNLWWWCQVVKNRRQWHFTAVAGTDRNILGFVKVLQGSCETMKELATENTQ